MRAFFVRGKLCEANYLAQQSFSKFNWEGKFIGRINFVRLKFSLKVFQYFLCLKYSIWIKGQLWFDISAVFFFLTLYFVSLWKFSIHIVCQETKGPENISVLTAFWVSRNKNLFFDKQIFWNCKLQHSNGNFLHYSMRSFFFRFSKGLWVYHSKLDIQSDIPALEHLKWAIRCYVKFYYVTKFRYYLKNIFFLPTLVLSTVWKFNQNAFNQRSGDCS